jgi:peptide/nickel transport system ATP-binding protein
VGESGCGKSTTALALLRLLAPGAALRGKSASTGATSSRCSPAELREVRGREIAMIFQEPMTSLNPVHTIGAQIAETLRRHEKLSAVAARKRAIELLDLVRIPEPHRRIDDHPHNLSGGQRQRVMIAMAVACKPRLLVADEPTTALDVTIQAQILELLDGLRREFDMALLLITHDLGLVAQWADRVAVMYGGEKVEEAATVEALRRAGHAYTRGLLARRCMRAARCTTPMRACRRSRRGSIPTTGVRDFALHVPVPSSTVRALPAAAPRPTSRCCRCRTCAPTTRARWAACCMR